MSERFPLTDMQVAYLVGKSRLIELGGRQNYYIELDAVGLDPARAEEALNRLVVRQEHLRTVILEEGEQHVLPPDQIPRLRVPVVDLTRASEKQRQESLRHTRDQLCEQGGLDPTTWPLFELHITRIRRNRCRVHLRMNLILLDGPSLRRCIEEWLEMYRDPEAVLPPVDQTFRQWRLSLAEYERSPQFADQWRYWARRLDTLPEAPQLPLARQPGTIAAVSFTGRRSFLTGQQWQNFSANYNKHRVLATTGLLHVYAETIGAWAANPHFCLNVVHQNLAARHGGGPTVVGQRSATLPLEVDLRTGDFWERARRLQGQLFRDMDNSDVTAVRIGRELAARSGWTQRAVFPFVFTSNQGPGWDTAMVSRPAFRLLDRIQHTPQVLIDDQIRDAPDGGISSMLDFVEQAFPAGLPDLMVATYRQLLTALSRPDGADGQPDLLPPGHRSLIESVNATAAPIAARRLEDGFLQRAAETPDALAVQSPQRALSYHELEELSGALASGLRDLGVGPEDVVPVVMAKGWEQVVAVLGVLRAGAAYCPIDAATPASRLRMLIEDCAAPAILVQSHTRPTLRPDELPPAIDVDLVVPGGEPFGESVLDDTDLAYVIYTSGSTGRPKGVMIEHRGAMNTVQDINERIELDPADRVFGISSLSFDLSVWDIFGSLAAGACLVLPDATRRPDPVAWAGTAAQHGVTVWNSVPALAEMLVDVIEQRPEIDRPPLRAFLLSGDWIPTSLPGRLRHAWAEARMIAMGGATEASIWSNIFEIDSVDPLWHSIPYGRPLRNQTMQVLDSRLDINPPWAVGQIHIGGVGLARGYRHDEQRTAERFIRHPVTGERLYRTGDLGRYLPSGDIEFLGREDRQVKIQGFRVEPGEVEAAVRTHPGVRDCVVSVDELPGAGRRLIALTVPEPGAVLDDQALRAHVRGLLPQYLVPGRIHIVDKLELGANGKVDVAATIATTRAPEPPTTPPVGDSALLKQLSELWAELLRLPSVGPDDNFFSLGGNSLLALRMVNHIRSQFGADLGLGQVFDAPSVRQLATCIEQGDKLTNCAVTLADRAGPHLSLFHVTGGSIARYATLAEAWPGRVRAFQSRALVDRAGERPATLAAMAASYREELQRHQPAGPYLLGGWSSGGLLAYEVARQLAARGHRSHVFMIDTEMRRVDPPAGNLERHVAFLSALAQGIPPEPIMAAVRAAAPEALTPVARDAAVAAGLLPAEIAVEDFRHLMELQEHELILMSDYRPGPLDQPTLLFLAADEVDRPDPLPGWRSVCPAIEVRTIAGNHFTVAEQFPEVAKAVFDWSVG